jgi:hypothetical protein
VRKTLQIAFVMGMIFAAKPTIALLNSYVQHKIASGQHFYERHVTPPIVEAIRHSSARPHSTTHKRRHRDPNRRTSVSVGALRP